MFLVDAERSPALAGILAESSGTFLSKMAILIACKAELSQPYFDANGLFEVEDPCGKRMNLIQMLPQVTGARLRERSRK